MSRTGPFAKVLAAAALPLAVGGLPQAAGAQPSTVQLVSHEQGDQGSGDPADQLGLWVPKSRDVSSGSSSRGETTAKPDYEESVVDEILAFVRRIFGKGSGGSGSAQGGPFSDSSEEWRKIFYDHYKAAAAGQVNGSTGQTTEAAEDPSRLLNSSSTPSGSTLETQSASPDSDPILPPASASEPIVTTQPYVDNSPGAGKSQPGASLDSDDPKAPKSPKSNGK